MKPPVVHGRANFRVAELNPPAAEAWLEQAATLPGSWWSDYDAWLGERSGALKPAPKRLGGTSFKAAAKAPGNYVHAN